MTRIVVPCGPCGGQGRFDRGPTCRVCDGHGFTTYPPATPAGRQAEAAVAAGVIAGAIVGGVVFAALMFGVVGVTVLLAAVL